MKTIAYLTTLGLCLTLGLSTTPAMAADSALELLELMQSSARDLNYQGKLVYQQETNLNTFRITHSSQGGRESVVYLDPKTGRDVESESTPDEAKSFSLSTYNKLQPQTQKAYAFDLGSKEWVANIECQVVVARPRDAMRYLHRYCIDPKTGMLLKYSLMGRDKQVVEQLMFTEINLTSTKSTPVVMAGAEADNAVLEATPASEPLMVSAQAKVAAETTSEQLPTESNSESNNWSFAQLPLGFEKIAEIRQSDSRTQIIVSDGMTAVSIFADVKKSGEVLTNESNYSSGAMNILTQEIGNYMITLMGEVPESTLEAIFNGLKYTPKS